MSRIITLLAVMAFALGMMAAPGWADHEDPPPPEHEHILLLHTAIEDGFLTYERCVDLANNRPLPNEAHHHSLHTGTAGFGDLDKGITRAGHLVIPIGLIPGFDACEDLPPSIPVGSDE